jgi:hypothetical protein
MAPYKKKDVQPKQKGITQSPILTFEGPKSATWVVNMDNHGCTKMGRGPKGKRGKASI